MVDDDPDVLDGYRRILRKHFEVRAAFNGMEGLQKIADEGPFGVVVSDLRMPEMDGIAFLSEVRRLARDTVRIMLTGYAEISTAIEAVNTGNIFRFLTKPCPPEALVNALEAGLEQYRLIRAERDLLEKTVKGAVKVLSDVLSLTSPAAYGRASRVRRLVGAMAAEMDAKRAWMWEIAAMLSQVGCVTLPNELLEKTAAGKMLTQDEKSMFLDHPKVGAELILNVPRLEPVSEIVAYQERYFDGQGPPESGKKGRDIPLGARVLRVALSYDALTIQGLTPGRAVAQIRGEEGRYDPDVVKTLESVVKSGSGFVARTVTVKELRPGMLITEDIKSAGGALLIAKGQEVTPSLILRLKNVLQNRRILEPICVQEYR